MDHHSSTNNKIKADFEPPCHCAGEPYKRPHVLEIRGINMDGIAVGLSKGHVVSKRKLAARPSQRKGVRRVKLSRFFLGLLSFVYPWTIFVLWDDHQCVLTRD